MLSPTPRKFENFTRPLYYNGYSPLLTHLSIVRKTSLTGILPSPHPIISPRLSGFRFPSIYAKAHALSHRLVVVYILYIYTWVLSNVFSLCVTRFLYPFLVRLISNSRKQKRSMVPERTCHRRFLFQSIKRKQREFLFFSLNLLSKSFLFFAIKPSSVFINQSTARITIYIRHST